MKILAALAALALQDAGPKPGKEHELLKQFEGEWDYTAKFTLGPGQEPTVSKGRETARMIAGGLFLVTDTEGEIMGATFVGHGVTGYDVQKKKYTGSWIDSMATVIYLVEGSFDEKGKILTETLEGADPQSGQPMKMRLVNEIQDKDRRTLKFFVNGPDGKEIEAGSIAYQRRK
jgi:hypothetical protein